MCELGTCIGCGDDKTYPHEWEEIPSNTKILPSQWRVVLFCGNCELVHELMLTQAQVDEYDEWLDDCTVDIHVAWLNAQRENMSEYVERFKAALDADAVMPMDF